jgi:hypothetical protein
LCHNRAVVASPEAVGVILIMPAPVAAGGADGLVSHGLMI